MATTGEQTTTGVDTTSVDTPSGTTLIPTTTAPGETSTSEGPTSTGAVEVTTSGETGGSSESTGAGPCVGEVVDNAICGGNAPYCLEGVCVGCLELSCEVVEPAKPACDADSGRCVHCTQDDDCVEQATPVCDLNTATCVPCTEHAQCSATACNLESGECFPEANVLYVEFTPFGRPFCSDNKDGYGLDPEKPFCTLAAALANVSEGVPTTIKIKAGTKVQEQPTGLPSGNYIVAIMHYGLTNLSIINSSPDPMLTFSAGNLVFMDRLTLLNKGVPLSDPAIECEGATLWMDHLRVVNTMTALSATDCLVHARTSVFWVNKDGGVSLIGNKAGSAKLWLENTFMTENGYDSAKLGAIRLTKFASADLRYVTIALNNKPGATIECSVPFLGSLDVRNSVLAEPGPHFGADCDEKVFATYESEAASQQALMGVISSFEDGEFRPTIGGELKDLAIWETLDPSRDYDGDPRPAIDGTPDYAGADHPL